MKQNRSMMTGMMRMCSMCMMMRAQKAPLTDSILRIFFAAALSEKLEIHKVCLRFSAFSATKNLSQSPLAASRSASRIYRKYRKELA